MRTIHIFILCGALAPWSSAQTKYPEGLFVVGHATGDAPTTVVKFVNHSPTLFISTSNCTGDCVAVWGDLRVGSSAPGTQGARFTSDYNLAEAYLGPSNRARPASGREFYDSTSDGSYHYLVNYGSLGGVFRCLRNFKNVAQLFPLGGFADRMGISYDTKAHALWVSGYTNNKVEQYTLAGTLLKSFTVKVKGITCLAYDKVEDTIWFSSAFTPGRFFCYSVNGIYLGECYFSNMSNYDWVSGEFDLK